MPPTLLQRSDGTKRSKRRRFVTDVTLQLRGGTQPRLVRCNDGCLYVLKLRNNLQGPNVLANEWLGTAIFSALGVNTPEAAQIHLAATDVRQFPLLRMEGRLGTFAPACGYHFGSRLVGDATQLWRTTDCPHGAKPSNITNLQDFALVDLVDSWANTTDRREIVFTKDRNGTATAWFIDHGHMFGGPAWNCTPGEQIYPQHHPFYLSALTTEAIERAVSKMGIVIPKVFRRAIATLPRSWYVGDIDLLQSFYMRRLSSLRRS